ncbi:MAG TPA: S-layer protein [Cyanobacteria bacterium UBA11162]|nr:S-layer protein [Cyanobacteria bacterium UBA11162]
MIKPLNYSIAQSILLASLLNLSIPSAFAFSDTQTHWAKDCINQMAPRKLVSGYPDGTFRPNSTITRAEFAVLMLNAFPDAPVKRSGVSFKDVPSNHWAHRAIQEAYKRAFFSGYPGGIFQPSQPIPRVQAIGVLAGAKNYTIPNNPDSTLRQYFNDSDQIPGYAKNAIAAAAVNTMVVNYPNIKQLKPNQQATRGEVASLICRALNIYAVPPQYIAGVDVHPQQVRALPGGLNTVPTFNSNHPELVETEGILLSTFSPAGKRVPSAHLNFPFQGRFDIFTHHIARAQTQAETRPLYQGLILHNPTDKPITVEILQAASYLSTPDAPFITLPDMVENPNGTVYSGPGSRTMNDVLRDIRNEDFPDQLVLEPGQSKLLMNQAIPIRQAPASNGRSTMIRLQSNGSVYVANLAMKAPRNSNGTYRTPTLAEWQNLLETGELAEPRGLVPTPLDPPKEPTVFGRVAGVSEGTQWLAQITDTPESNNLRIPQPGEAFSYVLGTLHLITLNTGQIQSAKMLTRYPDSAYYAHSNYGVEYNLILPLKNGTSQSQTVTVSIQTPLKDEGGTDRLLFLNPQVDQVFFRGTVKVSYEDEQGQNKTRYVHLVQRRGQPGQPLVTLNLSPNEQRKVQVDFIYPPDSTPPQVLTVRTLEK